MESFLPYEDWKKSGAERRMGPKVTHCSRLSKVEKVILTSRNSVWDSVEHHGEGHTGHLGLETLI